MEQMTVLDLTFTVNGRVQLDLERAQQDPWWSTYTKGLDLNDPVQLKQAVNNYVAAYLRTENLLREAPFTCGPADLYSVQIEVRNGPAERNTES